MKEILCKELRAACYLLRWGTLKTPPPVNPKNTIDSIAKNLNIKPGKVSKALAEL